MTKRHFIALAALVKRIADRGDLISREDAGDLCEELCELCRGFNTAFDESRFRRACGL